MSTFDDPEHVKLGYCKLIEEVIIGEDKLIKFSGALISHKVLLSTKMTIVANFKSSEYIER